MKILYYTSWLLVTLLFLTAGCLEFDDLRENPNDPVRVPPSLLFTQVTPTPESPFSDVYRYPQYHNNIAADLGVSPPVDYRLGSADFTYGTLRDIDRMVVEAERADAPVYPILAKFLRAYYYIHMSQEVGDIPLTEAMQGADIPQPPYDTQKSVYLQCLNWLDEANQELGDFIPANPEVVLGGDIYYNGELNQWQKVINAYTIRVLLSLSKKADDPDLDVKGRMSAIVSNPEQYPLMRGVEDNMQLAHRDEDGFRGAYNPNNQITVEGVVYADTYIGILKKYQDPRLQQVAQPAPIALASNPNTEEVWADFDAYNGSDISLDLEESNAMKQKGEFSYPNEDRFLSFFGQPSVLISYWEQELSIAEAAHRGWIAADAKTHYDNGVRASMNFYEVDPADIEEYITGNAPYIAGEDGLTRIYEQLYIALAENSDWQSWFMTRRTGVPQYSFSSVNNVEELPLRWAYPTSEDTENQANYREALVRQFGAEVDDTNQVMWLLKE